MKYIITESRLDKSITNYLDKLFDISNINWTHPYDILDNETDEEGEDQNRVQFYLGDYGDEPCFMWYGCEYFNSGSPASEICPTVSLEYKYERTLNGYFGDLWKEPFKKWFKQHFELPVKTIDN
jgi:hypothetical protein